MMTPKERLNVHAEIERQNEAKLKAWFEGLANRNKPYAVRVNKFQYLAVLGKALVIVTEDENHKPIRYAIFEKGV